MMFPDADAEAVVSGGKGKGKRTKTLSFDDCVCPVCLEMFLEPVTLPCTHTFCKVCFLESVDKSTLCCPLCRKRVSTWARQNNKNKTLVNEQLWRQIQISFPQHCQRRLCGQDAITEDEVGVFFPRVSQPGELRQEYQEQVTKLTEEKRELDEEEQRASEEYIQRLLAEEEQLLKEERRRREEDERLAKVLSKELNAASVSQDNQHPDIPPTRKKVNIGQIEKYLYRLPSKSNKENILLSQDKRLPELDFYGPPSADQSEVVCVSPLSAFSLAEGEGRDRSLASGGGGLPQVDFYGPPSADQSEVAFVSPLSPFSLAEGEGRDRSLASGDEGPSSVKRKSSELEQEPEETYIKRGRGHWLPLSSSSSSYYSSSPETGTTVLRGLVELEAELQSRRRQEEEDRQMALLLQQELNKEERQRHTDRRKGSADAYPLRRKSLAHRAARTKKTSPPATASSFAESSLDSSSPSSSSSSSSSSRGSKQTTLTDLYPNLGI
ncbi:E3 ubiquitin-protein ligase rnf168-like isoform X2 [Nerophis ophidion]|nr:E3 ubiquitin-protein ligase rnf168-like isoform X2 [Nerophis ophidion]XP_061733663.1 E3 ubiquitin-protein ligase rnf168-like isoform X2 [Nerophis ophidion]XP_061734473.1 E3 ubiquitin-protein ligase rnf168-like isoform X2 [Nerophis ophidion]XP_061734474.1 E3 ubiquitin-protein ligase rnf168-like isoform X2 [Nerophis ophidion]